MTTNGQQILEGLAQVRAFFKQYPLPFHKRARAAAKATLAAHKQGKFWPMHDKIFENSRNLSDEAIKRYAREIGLNMTRFESDYNGEEVEKMIRKDEQLAREIGVTGTPSFFVNGLKFQQKRSVESFSRVIEEELAGE